MKEITRKVTEPEHFVYIVLTKEESDDPYKYQHNYNTFEEAKEAAEDLSIPAKIVRGRKSTVLPFLKRDLAIYQSKKMNH